MPIRLREFQHHSLRWLNQEKHVITVAPTGSGKSLIFERFVQKSNVRAVIISPLIALARQQHDKLNALGVHVALGTSPTKSPPPQRSGAWIIAPERLFPREKRRSYELLRKWKPNFLVVDECHCIAEWGEDFRTAFSFLPDLIHELNIRRSLWLTATLPPDARRELKTRLGKNIVEIGSYAFPENLTLKIEKLTWAQRIPKIIDWLKKHSSPGIVFVGSRRFCHRLARIIGAFGRKIHIYHAGLSSEERIAIETQIQNKNVDVVIATSAFGMGMDYGHLEWCIIWQLPPSVLSLTQEIGRVGRNQSRGDVCVYWSEEDFQLINWSATGSKRRRRALNDLYSLFQSQNIKRGLESYFNNTKSDSVEDRQ